MSKVNWGTTLAVGLPVDDYDQADPKNYPTHWMPLNPPAKVCGDV
jgi:hypothetical protein